MATGFNDGRTIATDGAAREVDDEDMAAEEIEAEEAIENGGA